MGQHVSKKPSTFFIFLHKQKIFSSFFRGWPSCALQLRTFLQTNQRKKVLNCSSWPHLLTAWCPCDNRQTGADSDKLNITRQTEKLVLDLVLDQLQVPFNRVVPSFWRLTPESKRMSIGDPRHLNIFKSRMQPVWPTIIVLVLNVLNNSVIHKQKSEKRFLLIIKIILWPPKLYLEPPVRVLTS